MSKVARGRDNNLKYHGSERKLRTVLKAIFGFKNVLSAVHPIWAESSKGALLEFDFAIPEYKLLIERDGIQHYEFPNRFHKTRREFVEQKKRDARKRRAASLCGWRVLTVDYRMKIDKAHILDYLQKEGVL